MCITQFQNLGSLKIIILKIKLRYKHEILISLLGHNKRSLRLSDSGLNWKLRGACRMSHDDHTRHFLWPLMTLQMKEELHRREDFIIK